MKCAWPDCTNDVRPTADRRKAYCSTTCRVRAHRALVRAGRQPVPHRRPPEAPEGARTATIFLPRSAIFCYADPPYPDCADQYPENLEVHHGRLIAWLMQTYPDGWALSTRSASLADVLALCPRGVRVASWHRQARPYPERPRAWEPLIICGGRRQVDAHVLDALTAHVPATWKLPGKKPDAFYRWMAGLLGAQAGDRIDEPFPGSGGGAVLAEAGIDRQTPSWAEAEASLHAGGTLPRPTDLEPATFLEQRSPGPPERCALQGDTRGAVDAARALLETLLAEEQIPPAALAHMLRATGSLLTLLAEPLAVHAGRLNGAPTS